MQDLGWRRRWGSCPAARRGARQRAGLTPASAFNTLHACWRCFTQNSSGQSKCCLTVITVSTANRVHQRQVEPMSAVSQSLILAFALLSAAARQPSPKTGIGDPPSEPRKRSSVETADDRVMSRLRASRASPGCRAGHTENPDCAGFICANMHEMEGGNGPHRLQSLQH
jgi:hypothetical protein